MLNFEIPMIVWMGVLTIALTSAVMDNEKLKAQIAADPVRVHAVEALARCNYENEMRGHHYHVFKP